MIKLEIFQSGPIPTFIDLLSLCVMFFQLHSGMFMPQSSSNLPDTQALTVFPFPFTVVLYELLFH